MRIYWDAPLTGYHEGALNVRLTRDYGGQVSLVRGSDGKSRWFSICVWFRHAPHRLGYRYGSIPANLTALRNLLA